MALTSLHIIQKQTVELTVNGQVDGIDLQRKADELIKEDLMPKLDRLMDSYGHNQLIKIDKLEVEVPDLQWDDFAANFSDRILSQVEKELMRIVKSKPVDKSFTNEVEEGEAAGQQQFVRLMIFTLKHGYLPWWSTIKTMAQWQEAFSNLLEAGTALTQNQISELKVILNNQFSLDRISNYLSIDNNKYWSFIKLIANIDGNLIIDLQNFFQMVVERYRPLPVMPELKQILMQAIISESSAEGVIKAVSINVIKAIQQSSEPLLKESVELEVNIQSPQSKTLQLAWEEIKKLPVIGTKKRDIDGQKSIRKAVQDKGSPLAENATEVGKDSNNIDEMSAKLKFNNENYSIDNQINVEITSISDSIYINNAGLVILAPFLSAFFRKLNLIEDEKLTDKAKAITLLNYLVTGNVQFDEVDAVLNKVMCGEDLETFIEPTEITADEKQEADDLLAAVIEHWAVLKNTSPDGLRGTFLQREGRLMFEDNKWSLKVQEQSFDMLLAHLPWGIGVVKLPWMQHVIYVEWI